MKQKTATSPTPSHGSMVALLMRLGASAGEAYNVAEEVATEAKRVAIEMADGVKTQVLSRIDALQVALESFKSEVAARFKAVDQRFDAVDQRFDGVDQRIDSVEREMRVCFKALDQRFDSMERHFEQMHQRFEHMQAQFDIHHTGYRRLLLLLVVPVALAILAGVGGMIWEGISNWATMLP